MRPVAQWTEQLPSKQWVARSSRAGAPPFLQGSLFAPNREPAPLLAHSSERMRTKGRLAFTLIAGMLVVVAAGCRPQTRPRRSRPRQHPRGSRPAGAQEGQGPASARAPAPPGMAVSGFWTSWGRPLRHCLAAHRARAGSRCHGALSIVIEKSKRRMVICCDGDPVKGYFIGLGRNPKGAKGAAWRWAHA